jgi:hypothetical protein
MCHNKRMTFKLNEHGELEDPRCIYCQKAIVAIWSINGDHAWIHNVKSKTPHEPKPHDRRSFIQHWAAEDLKDFREHGIDPEDAVFG